MGNNEEQLIRVIDQIKPLKLASIEDAQRRLDSLTKPPGSLGRLESLAKQLAGITGEMIPVLNRKAVIVMAGDHGVCEEGISAFPAAVTAQMALNFAGGGAAVNVLARQAGADVFCVDIGINGIVEHPNLLSKKVCRGTANMCKGPAMSREEALQAIMAGVEIVTSLGAQGYRLFATGEMGIGNTTASAAIASVLGEVPIDDAVGRGTGIDDATLQRKIGVVRRALEQNQPDRKDPIDVLAKVGGLEIAGLVGVLIGAAAMRAPIVIDGFISSAAALIAARLCPEAVSYMIASHLSQERGHGAVLQAMGMSPMLHMDMRLGEGTGAVLCFSFVEAALRIMSEMATFESANISKE